MFAQLYIHPLVEVIGMNIQQAVAREETDDRVFFRRPSDDSIYCVLVPATIERLRKRNQLDTFLKKERDSGIVIRPINK